MIDESFKKSAKARENVCTELQYECTGKALLYLEHIKDEKMTEEEKMLYNIAVEAVARLREKLRENHR